MGKNKLFALIVILMAVIIFSTAGLFDQCGIKAESEDIEEIEDDFKYTDF